VTFSHFFILHEQNVHPCGCCFVLAEDVGISVVTRPVPQLARLVRFASKRAQSGFESHQK